MLKDFPLSFLIVGTPCLLIRLPLTSQGNLTVPFFSVHIIRNTCELNNIRSKGQISKTDYFYRDKDLQLHSKPCRLEGVDSSLFTGHCRSLLSVQASHSLLGFSTYI